MSLSFPIKCSVCGVELKGYNDLEYVMVADGIVYYEVTDKGEITGKISEFHGETYNPEIVCKYCGWGHSNFKFADENINEQIIFVEDDNNG